MKLYIYNENCTMAGHSVSQSKIDASENPDDAGDWTLFEGSEDELIARAKSLCDASDVAGAGDDRFYRQIAKTILDAVGYSREEIADFVYGGAAEEEVD